MKNNITKKRESNIELLRIIAILMIISFHFVYKSGYVLSDLNYNAIVVKSFYFLGELGVNLFILITGYFMIKSKISTKKIIKLVLEVNFYYIGSLLLMYAFQHKSFETLMSVGNIFLMFFSVIFSRYWFATAYILLYIISPYLNILVNNLKQEDYKKMLLLFLTLWCVVPTIFGIFSDSEKILFYNRFIWLVIVYLIGAYIRLYQIKIFDKMNKSLIISVVTFISMILSIFAFYKMKGIFIKLNKIEVAYFWTPNSILMALLSVAVFEIFLKIKVKYSKIINVVASTTLGIYLLHDGNLQPFITNTIFKANEKLNGSFPITSIFEATFIIFIVGVIVDLLRQLIEKMTVDKFLESKCYSKIQTLISKFANKVYKIF